MYIVQWIANSEYLERVTRDGTTHWALSKKDAKLFHNAEEVKVLMVRTGWCFEEQFESFTTNAFRIQFMHPLNIQRQT